jgi:type I restriction enzyme S subunit
MSTDWKITKFGDCAEKISSAVNPEKIDPGIPYVGLEHIVENGLQLSGHSVAADATSTKTRFSNGDILFGKLRPYFRKVVRPKFDGICSTDIWAVKAKSGIDQSFLFYRMASQEFIDKSMGASTGTRMPRADWSYLSSWEIPVPPINQQRKIASILSAFDDKIAVNQRMNSMLEGMARALFQSWFVDFDPVRAKLDGGKPVGIDEPTANLFPFTFQDSELGNIPKGWQVAPLKEYIDVTKGRSYRSEELSESKTALVTLKSFMRGGGYRADGLKPYTGDYRENQRVLPGDLIVAFTDVTQAAEVIGKPALIRDDNRFESLVASLDVGIVRTKNKHVSLPFLYCLFLTSEFQAHA